MDIIKHGEVYVKEETGEILSKSEATEYYHDKQLDDFTEKSLEMISLGLKPEHKVGRHKVPESDLKNPKEKHEFNKIFNIELQKLISEKFFDKNEFILLGALTPFVQFPYNDVVVKNKYLTFEQIGELCFMNKNLIAKTLRSLQKKQIIEIVQAAKKPPVIYFNPYLYSCGLVHRHTVEMFVLSVFNPYK